MLRSFGRQRKYVVVGWQVPIVSITVNFPDYIQIDATTAQF